MAKHGIVKFTEREWNDFFSGFPGSKQRAFSASGFFEFDRGGNLVDYEARAGRRRLNPDDIDGYELLAFSEHMQKKLRGSGALEGAGVAAPAVGLLAGAAGMFFAHKRGFM